MKPLREWRVASGEWGSDLLAIRYSLFRHSLFRHSLFSLLDDAGDDAGANGATTLADGEAQLLLHRDRHDQGHLHRDVVARHHHLGAGRKRDNARHVRGAEVELRL